MELGLGPAVVVVVELEHRAEVVDRGIDVERAPSLFFGMFKPISRGRREPARINVEVRSLCLLNG